MQTSKALVNGLAFDAVERGIDYLNSLSERRVFPSPKDIEKLKRFDEPLPEEPSDPMDVLQMLDEVGSQGTVASAGGRYFGFVVGGSLPAAYAANILAAAWDQNAGLFALSPATSVLEEVTTSWLLELLGLPPGAGIGFVSGATMANFTCLAAARHALLEKTGWDVEAKGLFGAPSIDVIVGEEVHVSLLKALSMLGMGRERVKRVPVDDQGRMRADALPEISGPAIVCIQSGNVNSGAFDPAQEICEQAHQSGGWVHVDGAFGLWALVSHELAHLTRGIDQADSWATDAHKWLNVPYDSGLAIVREPLNIRAAMTTDAAYLIKQGQREPDEFTPEMSRRARGIEIWAALKSLGRSGLADLVERCCRYARRFAGGLSEAGFDILNEVDLNQVLVSFGDDEMTKKVIAAIQEEGTCWCGGTFWHGRAAMRISVSSWATTGEDVERCLESMIRLAKKVKRSA